MPRANANKAVRSGLVCGTPTELHAIGRSRQPNDANNLQTSLTESAFTLHWKRIPYNNQPWNRRGWNSKFALSWKSTNSKQFAAELTSLTSGAAKRPPNIAGTLQ